MTPAFAAALNRLCRKHDVLLIADEVQTGLCRTGDLFASRGVGLEPDLVTLAKPLAGGLPLSAVLIPDKVNRLIHFGEHGTTFGGGPVTTAVALKVWDIISQPSFAAEVMAKGAYLWELLEAVRARHGERRRGPRPGPAAGLRVQGRRGRPRRAAPGEGAARAAVGGRRGAHRPAAGHHEGRDRRRRTHHRGGTGMSEENGVKNPAPKKNVKKIVLAYSGGLDTSIIIPWLKEHYAGAEVVAVCTDVGQNEDLSGLERKAKASGASKLHLVDARDEFVRDYLFPMLRSGALYEGKYLLGTSIARPLQAKIQVDIALQEGADAVSHGCTGKGNDQVRFELAYKALAPQLIVIAPWRLWDIRSREDAIDYAGAHGIDLGSISKKNIYSRDMNAWHLSHEGGDLEDPWNRPQEPLFQLTKSPKDAPDRETEVTIDFEQGIPVAIDGKRMAPFDLLLAANRLGAENGIGRADVVENRRVGMKSRGVYETPGGTILYAALRELEMLTLDADTLHYKQTAAAVYADLVYGGKWFTPLRDALEAFMVKVSEHTTGSVRLALYKGNIVIAGRKSPFSLYQKDLASFGASVGYDHADATGFINLYGLPSLVSSLVHGKGKK